MKIANHHISVALNVTVLLGLLACVILAFVQMQASFKTARTISSTLQLAQELRQSSDDLTRFIRTYTVTGNESYWGYFQEVIAIRDGKAPLPRESWRNYWDLLISDGKPPQGFTQPVSLLERMSAAGFTEDEMEQLREAKRQSDALIDLEDVAYHAMKGMYRRTDVTGLSPTEVKLFSERGLPNQTLAMQLVHSVAYHMWKGKIMRPIDEFAAMSAARVERELSHQFDLNVILVSVLTSMLAALVGLLTFHFCKIQSDMQTSLLLGTVLPSRVVDSISLAHFTQLKSVAREAAKSRSDKDPVSKAQGDNPNGVLMPPNQAPQVPKASSLTKSFPVLYSEFLPICWVAFMDVVSFTKTCRQSPASLVIGMLNELFSLFDVEANRYRVEKIKTIGDAFMCAKLTTSELTSGTLTERARLQKTAQDGIDMVRFCFRCMTIARSVKRPNDGTALELRSGLHVGPVASGIVGFERPLYDLFGDTVNTASRLESSGIEGTVHILETTRAYFNDRLGELQFASEEAGSNDGGIPQETAMTQLKGIGTVATTHVTGISSVDPDSASEYTNA